MHRAVHIRDNRQFRNSFRRHCYEHALPIFNRFRTFQTASHRYAPRALKAASFHLFVRTRGLTPLLATLTERRGNKLARERDSTLHAQPGPY